MKNSPADSQSQFFDQYDLTNRQLEQVLETAVERRADYADIYFESRTAEALSLEEGIVKKASRSVSQGAGVRVLAGDKTGYAHSDEITLETLQVAAQTARAIAQDTTQTQVVPLNSTPSQRDLYPLTIPPIATPLQDKIQLLQQIDE